MLTLCQYYKKCCKELNTHLATKCEVCRAGKRKKKICENKTKTWNCSEYCRIPKTWETERKGLYNKMLNAYRIMIEA